MKQVPLTGSLFYVTEWDTQRANGFGSVIYTLSHNIIFLFFMKEETAWLFSLSFLW